MAGKEALFARNSVVPFGGGSRVAMATPDQAVATPEFFGPMRRGGQEFIDILDFVYP